ncbi:hypothetical protein SMAC4_14114 [Sordaria macrospora]|uniref:uncharacterized protein n=1 Tax=Sordaria macrospora TaxID=5147 RepID=UPI002B2FB904|nr:hypothetical protein SMAC4_14114 [Sordaria macrospora]
MSEGPDHSDPQQEGQEEGSHRAPTWEEIGRIAPIDRRLLTAVHVMNTFSGNQDIQAFVNPYQRSAPNNDATGHWTDPLEEYYRKSKENEKWDGFWKKRAVVIEGKSTKTWDESPREAEAYQPIERDTAQMHPLHFAHYRMPWFQCVTDGCHEHYGKNQDNRFWPTRRLDKQGEPKPVTCTYSRGQSQDVLIIHKWFAFNLQPLGTQEKWLPPRRLAARPRNVYTCTRWGNSDPYEGWCPTADYPLHMRSKPKACEAEMARYFRQADTSQHCTEEEEAAYSAWLREHSSLDEPEPVEEDALDNHSQELENGSGPSGRPDEN